MVSIKELLREAYEMLRGADIETAMLDAEILLSMVLSCTRIDVVVNTDQYVSCEHKNRYNSVLKLRCERIPIAKIIGSKEFWGREFIVDHKVLDPRPDSETIIESAIRIHRNRNMPLRIADFGTGSGCLLITLLEEYRYARGIAIEKNVHSFRVAQKNMLLWKLNGRAKIIFGSWEDCEMQFDLIVSNPPYIKRYDIGRLNPEVRLFDPISALDGGPTGMECYNSLLHSIKRCLVPGGNAIIEIGLDQHLIHRILPSFDLKLVRYVYDLAGHKRCCVISQLL